MFSPLTRKNAVLSEDSPRGIEGATIQSPGGGGLEYFRNKYFETELSQGHVVNKYLRAFKNNFDSLHSASLNDT